MSTNQLLPVFMTSGGTFAQGVSTPGTAINATSTAATITSDPVKMEWEDNAGIHVIWTGTTTGTNTVQVSLDPDVLSWVTIPPTAYSVTPTQPSGTSGSQFYDLPLSAAAWIRFVFTRASGTGSMTVKIALKSV